MWTSCPYFRICWCICPPPSGTEGLEGAARGPPPVALTIITIIRGQMPLASNDSRREVLGLTCRAIMANERSKPDTRSYLYSVFFCYLRYTRRLEDLFGSMESHSRRGAGRMVPSLAEGAGGLDRILRRSGGRLLHVVAQDALHSSGGGDATRQGAKMPFMAFICLTSLLAESPELWLHQLREKHTIASIVNQLQQDSYGSALQTAVISRHMEGHAHILAFESLMGFLHQVASTEEGSLHLVAIDAVHAFTAAKFLQRPSWSSIEQDYSARAFSSPIPRHLQLLCPILILLQALLISLPRNIPLRWNVLKFVRAHRESLTSVLHDHPKYFKSYEERKGNGLLAVTLVTGLFQQLYQSIQRLPAMARIGDPKRPEIIHEVMKDEPRLLSILAVSV